MKRFEPEELLGQLASHKEEKETRPSFSHAASNEDLPTEAELRDYREGRLSEEDRGQLETILARSPEARARLRQVAGVDLRQPPAAIRARILESQPKPRRLAWFPAAAAVAAALVLVVGYGVLSRNPTVLDPASPRPDAVVAMAIPELQVDIRADAVVRSGANEPSTTASASQPSSMVEIRVRPEHALPGLEPVLYRQRQGQLERIESPAIHRRAQGGAFAFTAEASELLGSSEPGAHPLFVVITTEDQVDDLPQRVSLAAGEDPQARLKPSATRQIHPLVLELPTTGETE